MDNLWAMRGVDIAALVRRREVSALEVTNSCLERLATVNPRINAVVDEFPEDARAAAREVDKTLRQGNDPGELAGVPVTVKINVDQQSRATSNGLKIQQDLIAETDNPVVANLRRSGAIIIGRTNTPAFSMRFFTKNVLYGQTYNPHDRKLTPGGSSGGAAAAVASGIGAIALGTDLGGSIRYPAYACGVHGLRPTLGRIPWANAAVPDRHIGGQLMAVAGPIARSIADIDLAFRAMAQGDDRDPWWVNVPLKGETRYQGKPKVALTIEPDGLKVAPEVKDALRRAAGLFVAAGWEVEEVECPPMREAALINLQLWTEEMRITISEKIKLEADVDAEFVFNQACRLGSLNMDGLLNALQRRVSIIRTWQLFLRSYHVFLCPVSAELPFPTQSDIISPEAYDRIIEAQLTQWAFATMGLPALTVSTGLIGKTPVGVQLVANRYREDQLIEAGYIVASEGSGSGIAPVDPL